MGKGEEEENQNYEKAACLVLPQRKFVQIKIVPRFIGVYIFPDLNSQQSVTALVSNAKGFLYINACSYSTEYLAGKHLPIKTAPIFFLMDLLISLFHIRILLCCELKLCQPTNLD